MNWEVYVVFVESPYAPEQFLSFHRWKRQARRQARLMQQSAYRNGMKGHSYRFRKIQEAPRTSGVS